MKEPSDTAIGLARKLYDRFVMGGWEPKDTYEIIQRCLDSYVPHPQRDIDELAMAAATSWLEWEPKNDDPVGCPGPVADAVTEWAEALLPDWHKPFLFRGRNMTEHLEGVEINHIEIDQIETRYVVGSNGVTHIEAFTKSGMHADIPYVRIWAGEEPVAEFCQHQIVGVYFKMKDA